MAKKTDNVVELAHPDDEMVAPDTSFLSNPTDDTEVQLVERDREYLASISSDRRALVKGAREYLKQGVRTFKDRVDSLTLKHKTFTYHDEGSSLLASGVLTIKYTPAGESLNAWHLKKYMDEMQGFSGTDAQLVSQMAQDILMVLRPRKVSVVFTSRQNGLDLRAQATHEHKIGNA